MTEILAFIFVNLVVVSIIGWIGMQCWLVTCIEGLRSRTEYQSLLPDSRVDGQYGLISWVWTGAYRKLNDRKAATAVILSRVFAIAFLLSSVIMVQLSQHSR